MLPAHLLLVSQLFLAATTVTSVNGGNSLTLPAQRHLVRVEVSANRAIWLAAVQRDGAGGDGLVLFRSDDDARTFFRYAPLQNNAAERSTADLITVGRDVAVVYSFEGPTLSGSANHDVFFQWWRYDPGSDQFIPSTALRLFDSTSSTTAYSRAELARDSAGRLWIQAFRLNSDGTNTAVITVSVDNGASFQEQSPLVTLSGRGGGRLLALGGGVVFLYDVHDTFTGAHYRVRSDAAPVNSWGPVLTAFSEGIYHGAALSAVASGTGGMHLVYKANDERLYYRFFDGNAFSARVLIDGSPDWALQPAVTRIGADLYIFFNHKLPGSSSYDLRMKRLRNGSFEADVLLDTSASFKGYPAAAEVLGSNARAVVAMYSWTADASVGGSLMMVEVQNGSAGSDAGTPPPPFDAGVPAQDAGITDAGVRDAGTPPTQDAGTTPQPTGLLFQDLFNRSSSTGDALGPNWRTVGLWFTQNVAKTDLDGENRATEAVAACRDCRVELRVVGFGVPVTAAYLRAPSTTSADRYQLALTGSGRLQIQRIRSGLTTVLGEVASGISDLSNWATFTFTATGANPVVLEAFVNGAARLSVTDGSTNALTQSGYAGMYTTRAGVWFDDFRLYGVAAGGSQPDAGTPPPPDAGVRDAGTVVVDAGSPPPPPPVDGGTGQLTVTPVFTDTARRMLAVTPNGRAIAVSLSDGRTVLASTDNARTWTAVGRHPNNAFFWAMTALSNGTLLADVIDGSQGHVLARSTDGGASWTNAQSLGQYRALTPHSWAELNGTVFFLEYQTFTGAATPIRLWASTNSGASWSVRFTFTTGRHGHGLAADPARGALWALFGDTDPQSGVWRSTNGGSSFTKLIGNQQGDVVDATVLSDGSLLFGQDISYLPPTPHIARLSATGAYSESIRLSGPSYSIHAIRGGGFTVGATREPDGDVYLPGETRAHLYTSPDGVRWIDALQYARASSVENARADVYWELPSGELVVEFENISGMGPGGKGFHLLRVTR